MEGTRKNVRSEYKMGKKWGFVPKLGVTLVAALIILSLAACKNTADGGIGSSGGGSTPAVAPTSPAPSLDGIPDDDETLGKLNTFKFFVDENQIGKPQGVKIRGEVTFVSILEKANLSESDYKDGLFEGWKVKGTDKFAKDEDTFSGDTDFIASYKAKKPYKESVVASDYTRGMWRTVDKTKYIMFVEDPDGQHEVLQMSDMKYAAAEAIYESYVALYTEYPEHPGQFEDTDGNWKNKYKKVGSSSAKTDEYEAAVKKITSKFDSAMWFPGDQWDPFAWNGANHITVFDFTSGIDLPALYVGNDEETLRDADGNIVLNLIFE